jgi:hypothetical protein
MYKALKWIRSSGIPVKYVAPGDGKPVPFDAAFKSRLLKKRKKRRKKT